MSLNRFAKKRDTSERAVIDGLEKAGYSIWQDLPVDLLCFKAGRFYVLEVKTGKARTRKSQARQAAFIALTGCATISTPEDALKALGAIL